MNDTSQEYSEIQNQIYREMDPVKRFKIGTDFIDMGWNIKLNSIKKKHPELSSKEVIYTLIYEIYNISVTIESNTK